VVESTPGSLSNGGSMHQKQPPAKMAFAESVPLAGVCCWAYVSHGTPKRASTARKPIIRWTLNLDMCFSLTLPHDQQPLYKVFMGRGQDEYRLSLYRQAVLQYDRCPLRCNDLSLLKENVYAPS